MREKNTERSTEKNGQVHNCSESFKLLLASWQMGLGLFGGRGGPSPLFLGALHTKEPLLVTKYETLQGKQMYIGKTPINVFLGVPFSTPPVGAHKFAALDPLEPWEGSRRHHLRPSVRTRGLSARRWADPREGSGPMPVSGPGFK